MKAVNFVILSGSAFAVAMLMQGCQTVTTNGHRQALYSRDGEVKPISAQEVGTPGTYQEVIIPPGETVEGPGGAALYTAPAPLRTATVHTVADGDSISKIAKKYSVSQRAIISLNGLTNPNKLKIGQKINIPEEKFFKAPAPAPVEMKIPSGAKIHTVVKGDSVSMIAKAYGVRTADVLIANKLERYSVIKVGQKLIIPVKTSSAVAPDPAPVKFQPVKPQLPATKPLPRAVSVKKIPAPAPAPAAVPPAPVSVIDVPAPAPVSTVAPVTTVAPAPETVQAPPPPPPPAPASAVSVPSPVSAPAVSAAGEKIVTYRVKENEDVYSVALRWHTSPSVIRQLNNMSSDDLTEGQILKVPSQD